MLISARSLKPLGRGWETGMAATLSLIFMKVKDGVLPPLPGMLNVRLLRAQKHGLEDHVLYLLKKGALADTSETRGRTLLIDAANARQPGIVRLLLAHGANVDAVGPDGATALMCAAGQGDLRSATLLMKAGADLLRKDKSGRTAFDYASEALNWDGKLEWMLKMETQKAREEAAKAPPPPKEEPAPFVADVTTGQAVSIARPLRLKTGVTP